MKAVALIEKTLANPTGKITSLAGDPVADSAICRRDSVDAAPHGCDKGDSVPAVGSMAVIDQEQASATAALVAPLAPTLVRNAVGVIVAGYGDIESIRQSVDLWVEAHRVDSDGDTDQEIVKLTVPLTGPVKPLIVEYMNLALPGYQLHDWQTWVEPCDHEEPF
ncbi:MAG: hypothetical protein AAFY17_10705 [Cyanobacteria bacterium J06642_11]